MPFQRREIPDFALCACFAVARSPDVELAGGGGQESYDQYHPLFTLFRFFWSRRLA